MSRRGSNRWNKVEKYREWNLDNMVFLSSLCSLSDYVWPLPRYLCPVWISLDVLFSTASIMHLCAISLDRYVAIRNPIEHSRFNSRTKAIMKIAIVWAISIGKYLAIELQRLCSIPSDYVLWTTYRRRLVTFAFDRESSNYS